MAHVCITEHDMPRGEHGGGSRIIAEQHHNSASYRRIQQKSPKTPENVKPEKKQQNHKTYR